MMKLLLLICVCFVTLAHGASVVDVCPTYYADKTWLSGSKCISTTFRCTTPNGVNHFCYVDETLVLYYDTYSATVSLPCPTSSSDLYCRFNFSDLPRMMSGSYVIDPVYAAFLTLYDYTGVNANTGLSLEHWDSQHILKSENFITFGLDNLELCETAQVRHQLNATTKLGFSVSSDQHTLIPRSCTFDDGLSCPSGSARSQSMAYYDLKCHDNIVCSVIDSAVGSFNCSNMFGHVFAMCLSSQLGTGTLLLLANKKYDLQDVCANGHLVYQHGIENITVSARASVASMFNLNGATTVQLVVVDQICETGFVVNSTNGLCALPGASTSDSKFSISKEIVIVIACCSCVAGAAISAAMVIWIRSCCCAANKPKRSMLSSIGVDRSEKPPSALNAHNLKLLDRFKAAILK